MSLPLGEVVDLDALGSSALAALLAGVGLMLSFSLVIIGAIRQAEMRRERRRGAAAAYSVLAAIGLVAFLALIVVGLIVMATK